MRGDARGMKIEKVVPVSDKLEEFHRFTKPFFNSMNLRLYREEGYDYRYIGYSYALKGPPHMLLGFLRAPIVARIRCNFMNEMTIALLRADLLDPLEYILGAWEEYWGGTETKVKVILPRMRPVMRRKALEQIRREEKQ